MLFCGSTPKGCRDQAVFPVAGIYHSRPVSALAVLSEATAAHARLTAGAHAAAPAPAAYGLDTELAHADAMFGPVGKRRRSEDAGAVPPRIEPQGAGMGRPL